MNRLEKLKEILDKACEHELKVSKIKVYGYQYNYETLFVKSISKFWFGKHEIEEHFAPLNQESSNHNRPGTIKSSTEYIVIHDTASTAKTADEYAHAKYVSNGGGGTSWHYSVGSKMVVHQIPDNEVAYHAGDGLDIAFQWIDTNIWGVNLNPHIGILDGFYTIDGKKSIIKVPLITFEKENETLKITDDCINDAGLRIDLINNKYYMGPTYYNATYKSIANRGGNLNSIGIETMVNEGSNLMRTWHRCAKLVAHLLVDNALDITRVKPHHFFSGKPCPMTLRTNHLWQYFIDLVHTEYQILKNFRDVKITLIHKDDMINDEGLIKIEKIESKIINYQIKLEDSDNVMIIDYQVKVNH